MANFFNKKRVILLVASVCLTACGQKGALYLPEKSTKVPNLSNMIDNDTTQPIPTDPDIQDTRHDF